MIVVNLFGAPCTGKSTAAAYIFAKLKMMGIKAELVTEFAKDLVWDEAQTPFATQLYISGNQCHRINRCKGKVDVVVTDSPTLLGCVYGKDESKEFKKVIEDEFNKHTNLNYLLHPNHQYNTNGRIHNEEQSNIIANEITTLLYRHQISYKDIKAQESDYLKVIEDIIYILKGGDDDKQKTIP